MIKVISWVGTVTSIIGAFLVAFKFIFVGYCFFIVGSFAWLTIGYITKNKPLIVLNATFFVANLIGLFNSF